MIRTPSNVLEFILQQGKLFVELFSFRLYNSCFFELLKFRGVSNIYNQKGRKDCIIKKHLETINDTRRCFAMA